jgi:hypothetical protein
VTLYWALWLNFLAEVIQIDSASLIGVKLLQYLVCLLLCNVESTALDNALDLVGTEDAVAVKVNAVEGLVHVEMGIVGQTLSNSLGSDLYFEVNSPHVAEFNLCI